MTTAVRYLRKEPFKELKDEYRTRHRHWVDTLAEGALKQALAVDPYTPADQFLRITGKQVGKTVKDSSAAAENVGNRPATSGRNGGTSRYPTEAIA